MILCFKTGLSERGPRKELESAVHKQRDTAQVQREPGGSYILCILRRIERFQFRTRASVRFARRNTNKRTQQHRHHSLRRCFLSVFEPLQQREDAARKERANSSDHEENPQRRGVIRAQP